jgi:cytochrome c2
VIDQPSRNARSDSRELWRWLIGGLVGGGVILGLLIAAYAVGYHRGRHHNAPPAAAAPAPTMPTTAPAKPSALGPVPVTQALVARGKTLYSADGCSACHSLTGSAGAGPSLKGVAGSTVTLTTGQKITADDAYLERSILDPNAQIVKGYAAGVMAPAVATFDLAAKPNDVRALIAFVKSQK